MVSNQYDVLEAEIHQACADVYQRAFVRAGRNGKIPEVIGAVSLVRRNVPDNRNHKRVSELACDQVCRSAQHVLMFVQRHKWSGRFKTSGGHDCSRFAGVHRIPDFEPGHVFHEYSVDGFNGWRIVILFQRPRLNAGLGWLVAKNCFAATARLRLNSYTLP